MIKDIVSFFVFTVSILYFTNKFIFKVKKFFIYIYIILLILTLYVIFYKGDIFTALAYFRNFSLPLIFLLLGYLYINSFKELRSFLYIFIFISSVVAFISLYELIINNNMWEDLNAKFINIARGFGYVDTLKTKILDIELTRLGGSFLDSVNFSYFLSTSLATFLAFKFLLNRYLRIYIFFLSIIYFILLIFTFAKGGWLLSFFVFLGFFIPNSIFNKYNFLIFLIIVIIASFSLPFLIKLFPTAIYHLQGILNSIINFTIVGHGIGTGGNFLKGFQNISHEEWLLSSESALGTMLYQMGFIFTILYYGFIILYLRKLISFFYKVPFSYLKIIKIYVFITYGWILGSFFQENALSPSANFLIFFLLGAIFRLLEEFKYDLQKFNYRI